MGCILLKEKNFKKVLTNHKKYGIIKVQNKKGVVNMTNIILLTVAALIPASNYYSWFSPEIADNIMQYVASGEYHSHVDFNGDGILTTADAVSVARHYDSNIENGNEITVDSYKIDEIISENWNESPVYWEIDFINEESCREYEKTFSEITEFHVYVEFENFCDGFYAVANPYEERIQVK